jgi:rod shape-determining protein MreD
MRGLLVLTLAGGSVAHATLTPLVSVRGVTPDLPLIMVSLLALRRGSEFGCLAGFVTGLLQDAAGGGLIGVQGLTKAVIGFGIGVAGTRLRVSQPLVQVPGLVVLTIAEGLARFALLQIFRFPAPFGELMMYVVIPQALFNGFIGAAVVLSLAGVQTLRARFEGEPS